MLVVFDLDDTLYAERDYVRSGFAAVGERVSAMFGTRGFADVAWRLFQSGVRGTTFNQAVREFGLAEAPDVIADLVACYRRHVPSIRLAADAEPALAWAEANHTIALLTDGPSVAQWAKIEALRLRSRFGRIVVTEDHGPTFRKSRLAGFAALQLEAPGGQCIYVADNPRKDFGAPRRLGWRTCRVRRPEGLYASLEDDPGWPADRTIHSLRELPALVGAPIEEGATDET